MKIQILQIAIAGWLYILFSIIQYADNFFFKLLVWVVVYALLDLYGNNSQTLFIKKGDTVKQEDFEKKEYHVNIGVDNGKIKRITLNPRKI